MKIGFGQLTSRGQRTDNRSVCRPLLLTELRGNSCGGMPAEELCILKIVGTIPARYDAGLRTTMVSFEAWFVETANASSLSSFISRTKKIVVSLKKRFSNSEHHQISKYTNDWHKFFIPQDSSFPCTMKCCLSAHLALGLAKLARSEGLMIILNKEDSDSKVITRSRTL